MTRRDVAVILIGIIIVAAGLRIYGLDRQSIWYDEMIEEKDFQILLDSILYNTKKTPDVSPPLNSFFVYLITKVSPDSDFALRIPSFTFGVISVPLLFLLGRRLFNEKVGLTASFLLAVSPFHIWYSQDARMYTLQWMLALISLIYFIRALEQPTRKNFIFYLVSTEAGLYTHQIAILLVLLQGIYLLLSYRRVKVQLFNWTGILILLVILYLPWIIYFLTSLTGKSLGAFIKPIDFRLLPYTIFAYCAGFSIGPSLRELHFDRSMAAIRPYFTVIGSLVAVYCTPFILGLLSLRKDYSQLLLPLLLLVVPIFGVFILILVKPEIVFNVRYTATALFAFLLFVANGVNWLSYQKPKILGRILAVFAVVAMTGFSAYAYTNYQFDKRYHKEDIRGAVAYIKEKKAADDVILCTVGAQLFNRYSGKDFQCSKLSIYARNDKDMVDIEMRKLVEGRKRLWLVLNREWDMDKWTSFKEWLDTNYEEIKQLHKGITEIANVRIYCYDLTKKKTTQNYQ